ncbi:hypothetical protein E4T38_03806 [Aureobasidium subglaciale]|nr:hypothetical protein E4T38_03806 [Aureobasidium subglaciale]KAI5217538.1 hypothetical protein E4T41_08829 [Aureobasidium subglaciale]KAI5225368.1 hypothetical protein E4T40_03581 [Aureobasidium subglaciale]KAI5255081.1 hypothetical protein E4T46_08863 [Aureobasidium subglaciale]
MAESHLPLFFALVAVALSVFYYVFTQYRRLPPFPVVNAYRNDFNRAKAHHEYQTRARELVSTGLAQHHGRPFTIITPNGPKVILSSALSDWVKNNKDLDHPALVRDDFLAGYSGFNAQTVLHEGSQVVNLIKSKLSKNETHISVMNTHITGVLDQSWGADQSWHSIDWQKDTTSLISHAAASVFVGPHLAKNPEWQSLTNKYVMNYFTALGQIREWPAPLWPVAHLFNPLSRTCRHDMKRARIMITEELRRRKSEETHSTLPYNDTIEWLSAAAGEKPIDLGAMQLALAIAALFTTSEALRQTILEICKHTDIVSPLRNEVEEAIAQHGWTTAALIKMRLMDSVMKEAQRTLPASVGLERKALRDTMMPDGVKIPAGTHIAVDASLMWSPEVYASPETFDARRYLDLREKTGSPAHAFTATSKEHITFGQGRSVCPGRFFAETDMKLCLAQILLKYDFRLEETYKSTSIVMGFYPVVDPFVKVEVRRRNASRI